MGHIDGHPLYNADDTRRYVPPDRRVAMAHSFFDALADLHALDPDEIGLSDLGKKEDYVGRQVKTWYRSWTASVEHAQYDDPRAHSLHDFFLAHTPDQGPARVVHGDYGVHNVLIGKRGVVEAVVDWEISTLGDPLADLAYALNVWPDRPTLARPPTRPPPHRPGSRAGPNWQSVMPLVPAATCPSSTSMSASTAGSRPASSTESMPATWPDRRAPRASTSSASRPASTVR